MLSFPIDSHVTFEDGVPVYDRAITSEPYRNLLKELFSTGINPATSSCFQVTAGEDMTVVVKAGFAIVEGCMSLEQQERTLALQASDSTYDRIDTVVLRLNDNDAVRTCDLYIIEGTPSVSPVRPELTRAGSIYELGLADVFVPKQTTGISAQRITDTRYESERCGVMASISEYDTTYIYDQVQADLASFKEINEADFVAWVDSLKDILDEETAGHLQLEIEELQKSGGLLKLTTAELEEKIEAGELQDGQNIQVTDDYVEGETIDELRDDVDALTENLANKGDFVFLGDFVTSGTYSVEDLSKYKALYAINIWTAENKAYGSDLVPVSLFRTLNAWNIQITGYSDFNSKHTQFSYVSDTSISFLDKTTHGYITCKLYGVK